MEIIVNQVSSEMIFTNAMLLYGWSSGWCLLVAKVVQISGGPLVQLGLRCSTIVARAGPEVTLHATNSSEQEFVITNTGWKIWWIFPGINGSGTISRMQYIRTSPPLEDTYGQKFLVNSTHRNPSARIHLKAKNVQTIFMDRVAQRGKCFFCKFYMVHRK